MSDFLIHRAHHPQANPSITYMATNAAASEVSSNLHEGAVNGVNWGTFPGEEKWGLCSRAERLEQA